jgi:hypothetical protein
MITENGKKKKEKLRRYRSKKQILQEMITKMEILKTMIEIVPITA